MIYFIGTSHAAITLKEAARRRLLKLTDDIRNASLIFISEDTPTDEDGNRDLEVIEKLIPDTKLPIVITSQVTPGFTRKIYEKLSTNFIYHQAETLRIEDALQRALYPEMFIVGKHNKYSILVNEYRDYLEAFDCPILEMTYEEAEFCKIAINMTLISQVQNTNMLWAIAEKININWGTIANALRHDSRIGKYSYLTPGNWQKSKHLLRDYRTILKYLENHSESMK